MFLKFLKPSINYTFSEISTSKKNETVAYLVVGRGDPPQYPAAGASTQK